MHWRDFYIDLDDLNDYYDIWLLSENFSFDGNILQEAIKRTFSGRNVAIPNELPQALSIEFYMQQSRDVQWRSFVRQSGVDKAPHSLKEAVNQIWMFLSPVAEHNGFAGKKWNPELKKWHAKVGVSE